MLQVFNVVFSYLIWLAQPQRNMRRLHCLLYHRYKVVTQRVQVNLITQSGAKVRDGCGCVVFATVEAAIDDLLDASSERLKERSNR